MTPKSDEDLVDAIHYLIKRRGLKLPALSKDLGIKYRTLQNYLYKKSRMPIGVYLELCGRLGVPGDYPIRERFKLDFEALRGAVDATLGDVIEYIQVDDEMRLSVQPERLSPHRSNSRTVIAHLLQSHYDRIMQWHLDNTKEDDTED